MHPCFGPGEEAFRAEVRAFVAAYVREHEPDFSGPGRGFYALGSADAAQEVHDFHLALGRRGWLSLAWPQHYGGMGRPPTHEFILWDELAYSRASRPPLGPGIVAKTIISHGTDVQRARFLPGLRTGETTFSLGYSEPEAGSDLAALRTRAELVKGDSEGGMGRRAGSGDHYVVTGEKRWTSNAHRSDYLWLLCRTGSPDSRGRGLTILIVSLRSPGITITPIETLEGGQLNEVHLNEVVVPAENRVGDENGAWKLIGQSLAVERHVQFPPKRLRRDLADIVAFAQETGLLTDPQARGRLQQLGIEVLEVEALALSMLDATVRGQESTAEAAGLKLAATVLCQRIARAALELGCPEGLVRGTMAEYLWRESILETIGGGTTEVMRGIISRSALGLQPAS